jgi:hypothetical protein
MNLGDQLTRVNGTSLFACRLVIVSTLAGLVAVFSFAQGITEQVEVSAAAPLLSPDNAAVGNVVDQKKVVELPLNGRDYLQLAQLQPNVFAPAAGSNLFVGHGPHVLRGIEIYKGKPIFCSLANFIFENETVRFQPQENYDQFKLPLTATPADFYDARSANDTRSFPANKEDVGERGGGRRVQ